MKTIFSLFLIAQFIVSISCSKMAEDDLTIEREEEYNPREIQEDPKKYP